MSASNNMVHLIEKIKDTAGGFHSWWKSDVGIIRKPNSSISTDKEIEEFEKDIVKKEEPVKETKLSFWKRLTNFFKGL